MTQVEENSEESRQEVVAIMNIEEDADSNKNNGLVWKTLKISMTNQAQLWTCTRLGHKLVVEDAELFHFSIRRKKEDDQTGQSQSVADGCQLD